MIILLLQCISAQDFHESMHFSGCSDTEQQDVYGLDGEEKLHSDFVKEEEIYTLPDFATSSFECEECYNQAVSDQQECQHIQTIARVALEDLPLELDPPGAPLLYPRDPLRPSHLNTLVCQASGFYPAPVNFYWIKDGLNVSHSASVSQAYPQSDGTFTQFSRLDLVPEEGQVYSCGLEHPALKGQRRTRIWMVEFQGPSQAPSVFCAVGLTLGLVGVAVGTIFLVKGKTCT